MDFKALFKKHWILVLILILALFLRTYSLEQRQFATDEDHSLEFAHDAVEGRINVVVATEPHPPGYYLFLGTILSFKDSVYFARFITVLIGLLSIILAYFFVYRFSKDKTFASLTSLLLAFNPMHVLYSQQLRSYILLSVLYLLLTLLLYLIIFEQKKKLIYLLGLFYVISFYIHFYSLFLIGSHILLVLFFRKKINIFHYSKALFIFAVGVLFYIPIFLHQFTYTVVESGHIPLEGLQLKEIPYPFYKYALMVNYSYVLHTFPSLLFLAVLISLLFLFGIYKTFKEDKDKGFFLFLSFFGIFFFSLLLDPLINYLNPRETTIYYFRYFTFLIPIYIYYLTKGLYVKSKSLRYSFLLFILLGWILILNYYYSISSLVDWNKFIGV